MLAKLKNKSHNLLKKRQKSLFGEKLQKTVLDIPADGIFINYGNVVKNDSENIVHGGRVKLLHLQERFPENSQRFNILYLVSSAYPEFAEQIVQWAKRYEAKFVWNQDGVAYPAWAGSGSEIHNQPMRALIQEADFVIYQSEFCRSSADRFLGPISVPSEVLFNCVNTHLFSPLPEPLAFAPLTLLISGTHQQPERVLSVLETLAILKGRMKKDVQLIIAGRLDWPQAEEQIQTVIQRLGIASQVSFHPSYTQEEAPDLYRKAHVFIHTKYKDPCPTVVIEALSCGLPVIGSKSGGMPELIGDEGGILIEVPESWEKMQYPSPEKIADVVEHIFEDLERWQYQARQRAVQLFDKSNWIERHRKIFNSILSGHDHIS